MLARESESQMFSVSEPLYDSRQRMPLNQWQPLAATGFSSNQWSCDKNFIIFGDVNGHSLAWDPHSEEDDIGKEIADWATTSDFGIANTGAPARQSKSPPYGLSTPDEKLHHSSLTGRVEWETRTALSSDNLPIICRTRTGKRRAPDELPSDSPIRRRTGSSSKKRPRNACGRCPSGPPTPPLGRPTTS